jgi:hypothetical protein
VGRADDRQACRSTNRSARAGRRERFLSARSSPGRAEGCCAHRSRRLSRRQPLPPRRQPNRAYYRVKQWEFEDARRELFVAYVMSEDDEYRGDLFIFPVQDFASLIRAAPLSVDRHKMYISRSLADPNHWVLRRQARQFDRTTDETCWDVSSYRRNFDLLEPA